MFALENRLRLAIGTRDIPADRTLLAGISGVNIFNAYPSCIRFIGKKLLKLKEIPFVQVLPLFLAKPCGLPNSGQLFKSNYISTIKRFYDPFCNHMVSISSETVLLLGNLLKVSFGRFTSTGLQGTSDLLITLGNFFNLSTTKELVLRGNGNFLNTSVNTHNFAGGFRIGNIFTENYIKKNLVLSDKQFSGTSFPSNVLLKIFWNGNRNFNSTSDGKQRKLVAVEPDIVTSGIIPDRGLFGLWASRFLFFLNSCLDRLNSFSSLHASGYGKLGGKILSGVGICFVMQRYTIRVAIFPPCLANIVKRICVCLNGWLDSLYRNIKFKFYRACQFHVHILNMINVNVKHYFRKEDGQFLRHLKEAVSLPDFS